MKDRICFGMVWLLLLAVFPAVGGEEPQPVLFLQVTNVEYTPVCDVTADDPGLRSSCRPFLALAAQDGYYMCEAEVTANRALFQMEDARKQPLLPSYANFYVRYMEKVFSKYTFNVTRPDQYVLDLSSTLEPHFESGPVRLHGELPVRRISESRQAEIRPFSTLTSQTLTIPGGKYTVTRGGSSIVIESECWLPPKFFDAGGALLTMVNSGGGGNNGIRKSLNFKTIPDDGYMTFELPLKADLRRVPFDFVLDAGKLAASAEAMRNPKPQSAKTAELKRYQGAPLRGEIKCRVGWGALRDGFCMQGKNGGEMAMLPRYPVSLVLRLDFNEGGEREERLQNAAFFAPEMITDDTGKDLLSADYASSRTICNVIKPSYSYEALLLEHLNVPAPKATKISRIKGDVYATDAEGNPCRIPVDLRDIPLRKQKD